MVVGRDPVLLPSIIAHPAFDYVALGHVHRHQHLSEKPPVLYAGSLERFDFGDEDQDKGFYVVDIELKGKERHVTYEFQKVNARRFVTVKVDIDSGDIDPTATVLKTIAQHQTKIENAVVRVQLSLPGAVETLLRDAEINKALKVAHYVTIAKEVRQESRLRLGQWTSQELTPVEALRKYLEMKKVPEDRKKVLLEYGERLVLEAEQKIGESVEVGR
jgi:exonuclease SbcD